MRKEFQKDGIVFPLPALSSEQAADYLAKYQSLQNSLEALIQVPQYPKVHVLSQWAGELICHNAVLDEVEKLIGPNILCWASVFFAKQPRNNAFVGWHQDATYWGLDPVDGVVTAWLGLTDSKAENGCMQCVLGSHSMQQLSHTQKPETDNLLQSGQEVDFDISTQNITDVELKAGEFSIHHSLLLHGSRGNTADYPRVGYSIQYVSAETVQTSGWDSATLVRGKNFGNFELEPKPLGEFGDVAISAHARALEAPSGLGKAAKLKRA